MATALAPSRPPQGRFPLLRYFSLTSLVCTLITALAMGLVFRRHEVDELVEQAQREHAVFTEVLSANVSAEVAALLGASGAAAGDAPIARLDAAVHTQAAAFGAAKVKIYTADGTTVYSTRPAEIGESKSDNPGFLAARQGETSSSLVHRDQFNAFDHVIENRDLLQTYLPVHAPGSNAVIGVFELYSDMTALLERIRATERWVVASIAGTLLLLYGVLFLIVRRADRILQAQDEALHAHVREINHANLVLEQRVRERTAELERANEQLRGEMREREAAERALEGARVHAWQQDKLAAIGRLAAGIVHEIGNPLAAVRGLVDIACEELGAAPASAAADSLRSVRDQLARLEAITRDVSGFAVPQASEPELLDLNDLVRRVTNVMRYDENLRDVDFALELDHDLPALPGLPDQLWQVVMNLVLNAADAIAARPGAPRTITLRTGRDGAQARLAVQDQGVGMSDTAVARAFEPFQTSKPPGRGMGIGLSVCHAIVRRHGGDIAISSRPGAGATVQVSLPLAGPPLA